MQGAKQNTTMEIMLEKQIQINSSVFMIGLQMIQIRLRTSFPFLVSLCFVFFLDQIENLSPTPPATTLATKAE
jgi:hypothetical protein